MAETGRRGAAFVISLFILGGGHILLGRWRRGAIIVAGFCLPFLLLPWTRTIGLFAAIAIFIGGRLDVLFVRPGPRPSVARLVLGCLALAILPAAFVVLFRVYYLEGFTIPSGGDAPTLVLGDRIFVSKLDRRAARGDMIVFEYPVDRRKDFVQRVIGVAGDRIEFREGKLSLNGVAVEETDAKDCELPD